jgi:hypothetical protein
MCKVTFGQVVLPGGNTSSECANVICLTRRMLTRRSACASFCAARPAHTFVDLPAASVTLDPRVVLETVRNLAIEAEAMRERLKQIPHTLYLDYEDLAGAEMQIAGIL